MLYVALAEAVLVVVVLVLYYKGDAANRRERSDRAVAYEATFRQMADRIQRPERIPTESIGQYIVPEPELDEVNDVGAILSNDVDKFLESE